MVRNIVHIDEELCNGCGACAAACHEGAIVMMEGKAKLIKDDYCDGLGDCLPACPTNAIRIIKREANAYDEEAVKERRKMQKQQETGNLAGQAGTKHTCPGSMARSLKKQTEGELETVLEPKTTDDHVKQPQSQLGQWPVQIKLVPINAPYFENANLLIAADCTAYAYARFHETFMKKHITLIGCPKLDDGDYAEKLTEILKRNSIRSIKIARMEVPCCKGIENAVIQAMKNSQKMIPWQVVTITCDGRIKED